VFDRHSGKKKNNMILALLSFLPLSLTDIKTFFAFIVEKNFRAFLLRVYQCSVIVIFITLVSGTVPVLFHKIFTGIFLFSVKVKTPPSMQALVRIATLYLYIFKSYCTCIFCILACTTYEKSLK
jgi:hypothetical protein